VKPLIIHPIQTRIFRREESLVDFVVESIPRNLVHEGIILAVTSKIVSLAEGRLVSADSIDKKTLVQKEADVFIGEIAYGSLLTIKHGMLMNSSGIDVSNSEGDDFIIYPADPYQSAENLCRELRKRWGLKNLGVLLTDSHTTPLRRGISGICLSYAGFHGVRNMIGTEDIFGRKLEMTQINYADALASGAVMMMGEGAEKRPLAVIENIDVEFTEKSVRGEIIVPLEEDLYYPLLESFRTSKR
jgi:F420-0:gamma-glutamyl ligase